MWLISFLVCRWKLSCQIIFLQRKCPLMVFSPCEFDSGRGLICSISDKIRKRRQGSAVICFNNRSSLINTCTMEGVYSNGGHNSSFLSESACPLCLRQVIQGKIIPEPDPFVAFFPPLQANKRQKWFTEEYIKYSKIYQDQGGITYASSSAKCCLGSEWVRDPRSQWQTDRQRDKQTVGVLLGSEFVVNS